MKAEKYFITKYVFILLLFSGLTSYCQINPNINSGNPNFPFPQFLSYTGGAKTLANYNGIGVTHAEMEKWINDGYKILCNNMTYNINNGGVYSPLIVGGVKYIMPNEGNGNSFGSCTCVEEDGYYLLAAAYMGDKNTFDGYYMWMHDRQLQKTQRFSDCVVNSPNYNYSPGISGAGSSGTSTDVKGGGLSGNSALDGDNDVALALLVAWKQWGDNGTICINPCTSQPVKYKDEAIRYIKTMVDTLKFAPALPIAKYLSGAIGLDGYHKGGDSWSETTNWASNGAWKGLVPETQGGTTNYVDYAAPAYYNSFANMLTKENQSAWCIEQYKRAEASDDWLIGQAYSQGLLAIAGQYSVNGSTATFSSFADGEDFRFGWRTLLNYLWHGAPSRTWDPIVHNYSNSGNTYGYEMAIRFANFLKNTQAAPYNNPSQTINGLNFCGSTATLNNYGMDGKGSSGFPLNWLHGTGSPAVVISSDVDLMAQEFRECVLRWDQYTGSSQEYLTSKPRYFHEWFRLLGMLVLSGNFHDPMNFDNTKSNLKIYEKVNKTYAYTNDTLEYTLSWRNYAKANASSTVITDTLPAGLKIISSTKPYTTSSNIINWNIGNVNGFTSGNLNQTMDSLKFKVLIVNASLLLIKNRAAISCSNGTGWLSNEYPNKVSDIMERNYVDIVRARPLGLYKTASKSIINPGDTLIYTIVVKNNSVPFLNGGRSGVIISTANDGISSSASELALKYRIYHGAHEPLINYSNYRISYYLKKPSPPVWQANFLVNEGCSTSPTISQEMLSTGATWNHRFILQFPNQQASTTPFISFYNGQGRYIHQGALTPQRLIVHVHDASYTNYDWTNDWSAETTILSGDGSIYFPIGNDWTNPDLPNQVITKFHPSSCLNNVSNTSFKQLVEEWDGYTWRRVFGSAPLSGRDLNSIVIKDTLPNTVAWGGFENGYLSGNFNNNIITWNIPLLHVNDSIVYKYWVVAKDSSYFGCNANPNPSIFTNTVYGLASGEPLMKSQATVNVSCNPIFLPSVSLTKYADSQNYNTGDSANYTIRYINNDGAIYTKSSMPPSDWTNVVSITTITATSITTIPNNTSLLTNNYAHGKNGTLTFTVDPSQFATFGIALRNNKINISGGLVVTFKYETSTITIKLWNGNSLLQTFTVPGPWITPMQTNATFNHKIILSGNSLNVYVKDMTTPICNFTNLPINASGWVGIINGDPTGADNFSTHIITKWNSHFDSAFDLKIYDPIPNQLNFISAATTIYNNVNYSGTKNNSNVEWTIVHGPITANDSIFFKWKGKIINCNNAIIKNIAYANRYGIVPDDNAIVETPCGSVNTGILNNSFSSETFKIFPNPTEDIVTITGLAIGDKISVYDILGKVMLNFIAKQEKEEISTSFLLPGLYFISVEGKGKSKLKLVKE